MRFVHLAFETLLGRMPSERELQLSVEFLESEAKTVAEAVQKDAVENKTDSGIEPALERLGSTRPRESGYGRCSITTTS